MPVATCRTSDSVRSFTEITKLPPRLQAGMLPVLIATIIASVVVYNRSLVAVPDQSYLQVFVWQFVSWLPWAAIIPLTRRHLDQDRFSALEWGVAAFLTAFGCTVWFIVVSNLISPYLGLPGTMFGLYKWFLIFWFAAAFLFFWAQIGFYLLQSRPAGGADVRTEANDRRRVAIWHNGTHIILPKSEIVWIEAKNYYAQIGVEGGQSYWVKMRLTPLVKELASDRFVRVHRSAVINVDHLERIDRAGEQGWEALMKGGRAVRLSRAGKARLDEALSLIR